MSHLVQKVQVEISRRAANQQAMGQEDQCDGIRFLKLRKAKRQKNVNKSRFCWTLEKEEKLVELWSEQECFFDVSSHFYHNKEITAAPEIPGEFTT